jgi:hypothetical protein
MNDKQINEVIAKICGWDKSFDGWWFHSFAKLIRKENCPNYCSDLNDMHEAEKILTEDQQEEYAYRLKEICCPITGEDWMAIHATARQRAEAFLIAIKEQNNS